MAKSSPSKSGPLSLSSPSPRGKKRPRQSGIEIPPSRSAVPLNDKPLPGPKTTEQQTQSVPHPRLRPQKIIVLGAGVSGLACSRELKQRGYEVLVVEARSRVGGRLKGETLELGADYPTTLPKTSSSSSASASTSTKKQERVDVGGALIHGIENNPIYQITSQMGVPIHPVSSYCLLMDENGWPFDPKLDERTSNFFNECLDVTFALAEKDRGSKDSFGSLFEKVCRAKSNNTTATTTNNNNNWETPLLKWHRANLELPSGASFYNLGHTWNEDEPYGFDGVHAAVEPSWNLVMEQLAEGLDVIGNSPVEEEKVHYEPSSTVQITLRDGTVLEADALVCTLPLGVLKLPQNDPCHVHFLPSLDPKKKEAIQNLGCGLLNKCAISFENVFWQDSDFLGLAHSHYSYLVLNATKYTQKPILIFMYGGDFAKDVEDWTDQEIVQDCLEVLKKICVGSREIPAPVDYCITRWGKEEFSRMAFTCIPPGVDGAAALRAIGQPICDPIVPQKPMIMFAGEHTTPYHPSTMHGAFLSGIREAYRFDLFMEPVLNNQMKFDDQIHVYKHSFPMKRVYKKSPAAKKRKSKAASTAASAAAESKEGVSSSLGLTDPTDAATADAADADAVTTFPHSNNNMHSRRRGLSGMTLRSRQEAISTKTENTAAATTVSRKSRQSVGTLDSTTPEIPKAATRRSQRSLGSVRKSIQNMATSKSRSKKRTDDDHSLLDEHKLAEKLKSEKKKKVDQQEDRTLLRALESYGGDCYSLLQSHVLPVFGSTRKRSAKQIIEKWRHWESLPASVLSSTASKGTSTGRQQMKGSPQINLVESWRAKYIVRDDWDTHFARIAADAATEAASSEAAPDESGTVRRSHRGAKPTIFFGCE
eukprot:jgi/Psemu1/249469/estExt_Genewise1Plus.C_50128